MKIQYLMRRYRFQGHVETTKNDEELVEMLDFLGFFMYEQKRVGGTVGISGFIDSNLTFGTLKKLLKFMDFHMTEFNEVV